MKSRFVAGWNRFFFQPIPAYSLGLFRIAYATVLLAVLALLLPDVPVWYGDEGVLPPANVRAMLDPPRFSLLAWFPPSELAVYAVFGCAMVAGVALLVGFWTRWASVVVWACVVSLHHRNVYLLNSGDHLLRNLSFLLMFAPAGTAFSVDRWRRIKRGVEPPGVPMIVPWGQRLLQLQVCILYFDSVLWKFTGSRWLDGTAAYYVTQLDEFRRFPIPAVFAPLWFSRISTWFALATEASMATLVWVRPLRKYVLCAGIALHLGLEYGMNIPMFQWVILASYCLFLDDLVRKRAPAGTAPRPGNRSTPREGPGSIVSCRRSEPSRAGQNCCRTISPPFREPKLEKVWASMVSFKKRTLPSTNRNERPPSW